MPRYTSNSLVSGSWSASSGAAPPSRAGSAKDSYAEAETFCSIATFPPLWCCCGARHGDSEPSGTPCETDAWEAPTMGPDQISRATFRELAHRVKPASTSSFCGVFVKTESWSPSLTIMPDRYSFSTPRAIRRSTSSTTPTPTLHRGRRPRKFVRRTLFDFADGGQAFLARARALASTRAASRIPS